MANRVPGTWLDRFLSLRVRPLALICVLFVILSVGMMMINSVRNSTAIIEERVTDLSIQRDQMYKQYQKLKNEVEIIDDDDYIIAKARQLYGYMMPGELLFVIKNPEALYDADEPIQMMVMEEGQ